VAGTKTQVYAQTADPWDMLHNLLQAELVLKCCHTYK
jgi:hypothetical protein